MSQTELETVIALQDTLDHLAEARRRLEGVPDWMRELHEEHSERKEEIEALEQAIEEARLERRNAEGAIEEQQVKLKRYQEQINTVQNQREYGALLQEIDTAKGEISSLETQAYAAMEKREEAEEKLEKARESFRELDERYEAELAKWEAEKPSVEREVQELEKKAEELRSRLPRPLLAQFERLRERLGGQALATVGAVERGRGQQFWHCEACNYRVRPQAVVQVRNGRSLVHCDSCRRILYIASESQAEEEA